VVEGAATPEADGTEREEDEEGEEEEEEERRGTGCVAWSLLLRRGSMEPRDPPMLLPSRACMSMSMSAPSAELSYAWTPMEMDIEFMPVERSWTPSIVSRAGVVARRGEAEVKVSRAS
jgi:hypothetical protein